MDRTRVHEPADEAPAPEPEIEELEPTGAPVTRPPQPPRPPRRLLIGAAGPAALISAFLACAVALGAAGTVLTAASGTDRPDGSTAGSERSLLGHESAGTVEQEPPGDAPTGEPEATEEPKATETPKETDQPNETEAPRTPPKTEPTTIELGLTVDGDGRVHVDWSGCERDGFDAWKIVRSTNEGVALPMGEGDTIVGAIEDPARTWLVDAKAPAGRTLWYRVFGVAWKDGYVVLCRSNIARIVTPEREPEPTTSPDPKPEPKPEPMGLELSLHEGGVLVDWSACGIDGFDIYKVVRSKDGEIHWPLGDDDTLVGATEDATKLFDGAAPSGRTLYYRVYCLDKGADGYRVLRYTAVRAITRPSDDPGPKPTPTQLESGIGHADGGGVVIEWSTCVGDGFRNYKVVRSANEDPSYLPPTDGSVVIAVIETRSTTRFVDREVGAGQWFYRVQCIGLWDGQKVLLGQTSVRDITVD